MESQKIVTSNDSEIGHKKWCLRNRAKEITKKIKKKENRTSVCV